MDFGPKKSITRMVFWGPFPKTVWDCSAPDALKLRVLVEDFGLQSTRFPCFRNENCGV